jgi:hypothetical protein
MRSSYSSFVILGLMAGALALPACEDSGGEVGGGGSGATGGSTMTGGGGTAGSATGGDGGAGATGGSTMMTGGGGAGGSTGPVIAKCPGGPTEALMGVITDDTTLTADKCWLVKGIVRVNAPAKLTIEPGATIMGEQATLGTLVIQPGAQIIADGTADLPIVFTSENEPGSRAAGDWGGLIVLGKAPINVPGGTAVVEGITGDGTMYGGTAADDNSGVIRYVRIEFSGIQLSANNEVNGLTLAGVGNKTVVENVMVHDTLDDCFEFFGGTVNAKHLVCANNQDDGFDWTFGYSGKLQFLALVQDPLFEDDTNGFEGDNDDNGSTNAPLSNPMIYNVTLCGKNAPVDGPKKQMGMLLRRSTKGTIRNTIATGFEWCADLRDPATDPMIESSICFGNTLLNVGEQAEIDWFNKAGSKNAEMDPKIKDCFAAVPDFTPEATLTTNAATPPNDGFFDTTANYIGAFKAGENWAKGAWISFDRK